MKTDPYYQFPISALSYGMDRDRRWNDVLYFACLHYGREALKSTLPAVVESKVEAFLANNKEVSRDPRIKDQTAILFALASFGLNVPGLHAQNFIKSAEKVAAHCATHPYPTVRIKADFWWKTFNPGMYAHPISYREFAVLCAVYAGIGNKTYAKLSVQQIRRYSAGIPGYTDFLQAEQVPQSKTTIFSTRQIRSTLDALEANHFFAKFSYNRGECFFSNKMDRGTLKDLVGKRKLKNKLTVASNRGLDQVSSREIKELKKHAESIWPKAA